MDKNKLIKKLKSMLDDKFDDNLIIALIYLGDEDTLALLMQIIKKDKERTGRYFTSEDYLDAIGALKCKNYKESVNILVQIILDSNQDIAYKASNALVSVINRIDNIDFELLPLIKLLNYREYQTTLGSLDRAELGFKILKSSDNIKISSFLLNYLNAKYSNKDEISVLDVAKILPNIKFDKRLVHQLISSIKDCTHSYTIETVIASLKGLNIIIENRYCKILTDLIYNNFIHVDENDKNKVLKDSFIALGNICDEKILPFLIKSIETDSLKEYVPFALKGLNERGVLI